MSFTKKNLPSKAENISDWYLALVQDAELADYGPVKGTMIIRPYGYAIWELLQRDMDAHIKEKGVENAYFPIFIPESFLNKEKSHVEGFAPEVAVVTYAGGEELTEKIVVRPTSETIMYDSYSKWVQSWRDLPILINQWNNVVRWEKRTFPFMRTSEFLWQEGHTAHATHDESLEYVKWAMDVYKNAYYDLFAIPGFVGKKSESEKFAGGIMTLTFESLMPDGKALQSCTSHDLGQNFAKAFDISFQNQSGEKQYAWQTSWGFSTRSIGGLIMMHGDDQGLRLPPRLAPTQIVILPVRSDEITLAKCEEIRASLAKDFRVKVDERDDERIGFKINKWELKGVPLRIELGQKELEQGVVTISRRDTNEKMQIKFEDLNSKVDELLKSIQQNLLDQAQKILEDNTHITDNYEEFKNIMESKRGFIRSLWCENETCEKAIKEETKASTRCLPLDAADEDGKCIYCGAPAKHRWIFAQSY